MSKTKMIKFRNKVSQHEKARKIENIKNDTIHKYESAITTTNVGVISSLNMYKRTYDPLWITLAKRLFKEQKKLEKLGTIEV